MLLNQEINQSLFTELTAEQAEMLAGGKRIDILTVKCNAAGGGSDSLFFVINGQNFRKGNPINMVRRGVANGGVGATFSGTARVTLMDKKSGRSVGFFSVSSNGTRTRIVSGDGSQYEVTFKVGN
ncbi:hypothetical protein [Calothrix sp. 336/3]|uniref:hypothetical protein n=1 Tax=Calothrix sp. 336/3 TaxID=1337936 RepID=UPI0004E28F07|nr:hypothetical protein [Calothrix sp. 336/3]AKG23033.1 hypothetical protein IJ00_18730 [Calothrix sp. 336/3]